MKKIITIAVIILIILIAALAPRAIHSFKTYGLRGKQLKAKNILECSRSNWHCINSEVGKIEDVISKCPRIQCFNIEHNEYYKLIYLKKISDQESILVLKGNLFKDNEKYIDIWVQTNKGINIHCVDGSGWNENSTDPLCSHI